MRPFRLLLSVLLLAAPDAVRAAPADAVVEACAGPTGGLRLAPEGCRPSERAFAWQRGGGVWVHDAEGRALGRSMGREGFFVRTYVDGLGVRLLVHAERGTLPITAIEFSEPDCRGIGLGGSRPGDVIAPSESGPLYLVTDRVVTTRSQSRQSAGFCQNFRSSIFDFQEVVPFTGDLGFTLPVPVPLQFGSGPLGPIADEFAHACAGPRGQLRLAEGPGACAPAERALAWQRLGGLRVYDGLGRDVGAALGTRAPLPEDGILLAAAGVWIEPNRLSGALRAPDFTFHAEPNCRGPSFARNFFWPLIAGQVFPDSRPGAFVVTTTERVQDEPFQSFRLFGSCRNSAGVESGLRLAAYVGPLPDLPLPVPLVVGFPGSPIANPAGPALPAGLLHACAGTDGRLREVEKGTPCLRSEHALRWPVRGGLRAQDAHGNDLGSFLELAASNVIGATMRIIDDASGLRFGVRHFDGRLGDDETVVSVELSFDMPFCRGTAFRLLESQVGQVFPFDGRLLVGTRLAPLVQRSARRSFTACEPRTLFPDPFLSTVVEEFTGVVPFPLPVARPLLVGPGQ